MFLGCRIFVLMVWCKGGGEVDVEGCGRLSVHDGLLGGSLAGDVGFVVIGC
jgi:hypothetical protein